MSIVLAHARASILELARYPSFSVPTLFFPAVVFLVFGSSAGEADAELVMASYAAFALLGVAFFQFGVGIAAERVSTWHAFLRTLPATAAARISARVLSALVFGLGSAGAVIALAVVTTPVALPAARWPMVVAVLLAGSVPFALLGIALGYWLNPRGALPVANLLYFALAYLGGLWTLGSGTAGSHAVERAVVPTAVWSDLLAAAVGEARWDGLDVLLLSVHGVVFGALALWGYRRDEGERFR